MVQLEQLETSIFINGLLHTYSSCIYVMYVYSMMTYISSKLGQT